MLPTFGALLRSGRTLSAAAGVFGVPAEACAVFGPWEDTIGSRRMTPLASLTTSALDVTV